MLSSYEFSVNSSNRDEESRAGKEPNTRNLVQKAMQEEMQEAMQEAMQEVGILLWHSENFAMHSFSL